MIGLREAVLDIIQTNFPALADFAQERVTHLEDTSTLRRLILHLIKAPDEDPAHVLFRSLEN